MASDPSADSLLSELVKRYAAISTYRDLGGVSQTLSEGDPPSGASFETRFRRPGFFRFDFSIVHVDMRVQIAMTTRHSCGADPAGAYSWTKEGRQAGHIEEEDDLPTAIAGAAVISSRSVRTIAPLLMPDLGGFTFDRAL